MAESYRNPKRAKKRPFSVEALEPRRVFSCSPILQHLDSTAITANQATINVDILDIGAAAPDVSIYWGDEPGGVTPENWDNVESLGLRSESFSWNLAGLDPKSTYYFRAFAENACGSDWATSIGGVVTQPDSVGEVVAFNDYFRGGATHPNTTSYAPNGTSSGPALNVNTGFATDITLTTSQIGVSYAGSQSFPAQDTDAEAIFDGFVDLGQGGLEVAGNNDRYTYRYSGLDPSKSYDFAGTAIRGNDAYTNRWTLLTLVGADTSDPIHSDGVGVLTTGLADNQVAVWFGANHNPDQGFVAQWTNIDPGSDGVFEVTAQQYTGSIPTSVDSDGIADGSKGYAPSVVRLVQSAAGFSVAQVTPRPAEVFESSPQITTIQFTEPIDAGSVAASDLRVDGAAAIAFSVINPNTVQWILPQDLQPGHRQLELAEGAISSVSGESLTGFSSPFTIAAPPQIENGFPSGVLSSSATLSANVINTGFDPPRTQIHWGTSDGGTDASAWENVVDLGRSDPGTIDTFLSGLSGETTYYFRAAATNATGTTWAPATGSFTTSPIGQPGVNATEASNIGPSSADVTVINSEADQVTLYYGTSEGGTDPSAWAASTPVDASNALTNVTIPGLNPDSTYFYRVFGSNAIGTVWSQPQSFATTSLPSLVISEIGSGDSDIVETRVRPNLLSTYSGDESSPDWIEIHNPNDQPIDLGGYHLTDDTDNDDKWTFPTGTSVPADGYLVVFASNENLLDTRLDESGRLHTNFRLSDRGEYLSLNAPDGSVVYEYSPEFPRLFEGFTVGLDSNDNVVSFATPTPGAVNLDSSIVPGFVGDTNFSVDRGFFDSAFTLQVSTPTEGATLVYTTDGSTPTLFNGTRVQALNESTPPVATFTVSTTTVVRARAYRDDWVPTNIDTQTYIFLDDVINQPASPAGFPSTWGGAPVADYGVDPQIANDTAYREDLLSGLRELPTLSIAAPTSSIFGSSGIYSNTQNTNLEITASAELIDIDGSTEFQVDAGLTVQGGASRNPDNSPKHAFSLRFRDDIADGKLDHDVFQDGSVTSFDSLQLRSRYNNSWIHWNEGQRRSGTLIRDQWIRDSMIDMGNPDGGRSRSTHLYINGLYWGVYSIEERTDAAHYAEYHGGDEGDFDALNGDNLIDGNLVSYNAMRATVSSRNWDDIQEVLDVDNFIDFFIIQQFGRNNDLKDNGNWRAAGGGPNNAPWRFYPWDSERTLEGVNENALSINDPVNFLSQLRQIEEFNIRYADRIHMHLFNDGALTPEKNIERWNERVDELENAIVAESARWGDYRRDAHRRNCGCDLYDRDDYWLPEVNRIRDSYFPTRTATVLGQYRSAGYYPNTTAPNLLIDAAQQHGGEVAVGAELSFSGSNAAYYTLDGSDPRAEGGGIAGTAFVLGSSIPLTESTTVKVRALNRVGEWSALQVADFVIVPAAESIAITEINYHPHDPTPAERNVDASLDADDFEFIEVANTHATIPINVLGMQFTNGVTATLPDVTLAPGERAVVVENRDAFRLRYGDSVTILGEWSGGLSNSGESLEFVDAAGNSILDVEYGDDDQWPESADGDGATLVWRGEFTGESEPTDKHYSWVASREFGGTPGTASTERSPVVVNEVLTNSGGGDAIELYNPSANPIDIGGWFLSDSGNNLRKYQIPSGTVIAPDGFFVVDESAFNPNPDLPSPNDFGLSGSRGDNVWFTSLNAVGQIEFVDDVHFGAAFEEQSLARDEAGRLITSLESSLGCFNHAPTISPIVITEINYAAADDLEYIEITNQSASTMDVSDWRIAGGIEYNIPAGTTLQAGASLLILPFNPLAADNSDRLQTFITNYAITEPVNLRGGYDGRLSNSGEPVRLEAIDPDANSTAHVLVDEVVYDDSPPWDILADNEGISLRRRSGIAPGNVASNWVATAPNPGQATFDAAAGDFDADGQVTARDIDILFAANRMDLEFAAFDLNGDSVVNHDDVAHLVQSILSTSLGDATLDGNVNDGDFAIWNANRFDTCSGSWARGDFNGDGIADVSDFNIWNTQQTLAQALALTAAPDNDEPVSLSQNAELAEDVNNDGSVSPLDALLVINWLNNNLDAEELEPSTDQPYVDTNGDNQVTPLDALGVINFLNEDDQDEE